MNWLVVFIILLPITLFTGLPLFLIGEKWSIMNICGLSLLCFDMVILLGLLIWAIIELINEVR